MSEQVEVYFILDDYRQDSLSVVSFVGKKTEKQIMLEEYSWDCWPDTGKRILLDYSDIYYSREDVIEGYIKHCQKKLEYAEGVVKDRKGDLDKAMRLR